jgi:fructose-1,6-bisphosphatase/inositol monophosphatase family enzyme
VDNFRTVMEPFKFYLPNGGPYGFVDVAEGKIDCYFAPRQPFVDIFSGIYVAMQAETVVTDFDGNAVKFEDNVHGLYDVVASTNRNLHDQVLDLIAKCK